MSTLNKVEYEAITKKMKDIDVYTEDANNNLTAINNLIEETVGANGAAWSGESAVAFKTTWDELAGEFTSFVGEFKKQSTNIQNLLTQTKIVDTAETGAVNIQ